MRKLWLLSPQSMALIYNSRHLSPEQKASAKELVEARARGYLRRNLPDKIGLMATALFAGQILGYATKGADYLGLFMEPSARMGGGWKITDAIANKIPATKLAGVALTAAAIGLDASRMYFERKLIERRGYVADTVATAVGQPRWSFLETVDKAIGAVLKRETLGTAQHIGVVTGSIYGSFYRYGQDLLILAVGHRLHNATFGRVVNKLDDRFQWRSRGQEEITASEAGLKELLGPERFEQAINILSHRQMLGALRKHRLNFISRIYLNKTHK